MPFTISAGTSRGSVNGTWAVRASACSSTSSGAASKPVASSCARRSSTTLAGECPGLAALPPPPAGGVRLVQASSPSRHAWAAWRHNVAALDRPAPATPRRRTTPAWPEAAAGTWVPRPLRRRLFADNDPADVLHRGNAAVPAARGRLVIMTTAYSILLSWVFLHTRGSVLIATLFHGAINVSQGYFLAGTHPASRYWWLALAYGAAALISAAVVLGPGLSRRRTDEAAGSSRPVRRGLSHVQPWRSTCRAGTESRDRVVLPPI